MTQAFYQKFEDKYRGTRGLIKSRLHQYLPFLEPLQSLYPQSQVIDLGCGRGEWLELLAEQTDFAAFGVDSDPDMLAIARQHGLHVSQGDALSYLKQLDDQSQSIVSGFHIAEHIDFNDLQSLVQQAYRVLKPAGLLILETPNPENIRVGSESFYLDPTHRQPLPAKLLSFIPKFYHFQRVKILRLQETIDLKNHARPSLLDVLQGVSPDYAIVAQKKVAQKKVAQKKLAQKNKNPAAEQIPGLTEKIAQQFSAVFDRQYGLSLEQIGQHYQQVQEQQQQQHLQQTQASVQQIQTNARQIALNVQQINLNTGQIDLNTRQIEQNSQQLAQFEARTLAAEAHAQQLQAQLFELLNSKSWRYSRPLRLLLDFFSSKSP